MKRFLAAMVDFVICSLLVEAFFGMSFKSLRNISSIDWNSHYQLMYRAMHFLWFCLVNFFYSFLFDNLCRGWTLGKLAAGYRICVIGDEVNRKWMVKHALFRMAAIKLYPIAAIYCYFTYRMPYDGMLGILREEPVEGKEIAEKRFVAVFLDAFLMVLLYGLLFGFIRFLASRIGYTMFPWFFMLVVVTLIYPFVYFVIPGCMFRGSSPGKKIMGIRLQADGKEFDIAMMGKHLGLKFAACCLWPFSLFYYLTRDRMFYDGFLKLEVVAER